MFCCATRANERLVSKPMGRKFCILGAVCACSSLACVNDRTVDKGFSERDLGRQDASAASADAAVAVDPGPAEVALVEDPNLRACDVLLKQEDEATVAYDDSVIGHFAQRGNRLALAFTARKDVALSTPFTVSGAFSVLEVTCYDREGKALSNSALQLSSAVERNEQAKSRRGDGGGKR